MRGGGCLAAGGLLLLLYVLAGVLIQVGRSGGRVDGDGAGRHGRGAWRVRARAPAGVGDSRALWWVSSLLSPVLAVRAREQLPAHTHGFLRSMRACVQMLAPDAQALAAAAECASEVARHEAAQLRADLAGGQPARAAARGRDAAPGPAAQPVARGRGDAVPPLAWSPRIHLQWCAPFFSGGGYCSEAISYVSELQKWLPVGIVQVPAACTHPCAGRGSKSGSESTCHRDCSGRQARVGLAP